jgi:hypothetical protein
MLFGGLIFGAVTDKFGRQKVYIADLRRRTRRHPRRG